MIFFKFFDFCCCLGGSTLSMARELLAQETTGENIRQAILFELVDEVLVDFLYNMA